MKKTIPYRCCEAVNHLSRPTELRAVMWPILIGLGTLALLILTELDNTPILVGVVSFSWLLIVTLLIQVCRLYVEKEDFKKRKGSTTPKGNISDLKAPPAITPPQNPPPITGFMPKK